MPAAQDAKTATNTLVWVDVPVQDLDRAVRFYSAVLGAPSLKQEHGGMAFAVLPHAEGGIGGCLIPSTDQNKPSANGPLIYLSCQGRLDEAVAKVSSNGGKVLQARHPIGPYGFRAIVLDSEGNRIALHSM
jgi:hypothetical protein